MKTALISKEMKTYANYDETNPIVKEFAKIWLKYKRHDVDLPIEVMRLSAKSGFVGSGFWMYGYKGNVFTVAGYANGRGFWGTDYSISINI